MHLWRKLFVTTDRAVSSFRCLPGSNEPQPHIGELSFSEAFNSLDRTHRCLRKHKRRLV